MVVTPRGSEPHLAPRLAMEEVAEGNVVLVARVLGLLVTLIGVSLTERAFGFGPKEDRGA